MKNSIVIVLSFLCLACFGQVSDFTENFIADSTGMNGFRNKSMVYDSLKKTWLINGLDIRGYSKKKTLKLLGKPNSSGTSYAWGDYEVQYAKGGMYFCYILSANHRVNLNFVGNKVIDIGFLKAEDIPHNTYGYFSEGNSHPPPTPVIEVMELKVIAKIKGKDTINFNTDTIRLNCNGDLRRYLKDHMQYPEVEREAMITGTVYVSFIVRQDTSVTDIKIIRHVPGGVGLDKEVVRVVSSIPKIILPYREKGRRIAVVCTLAIMFKLR